MADAALVFRNPPVWGGTEIAAAAAALVAVLWGLKAYVSDPDFGMVIGWLGACLAGPVTLLWAGSWTELRIDPGARTLSSKIGFLQWGAGPDYQFADFDRVLVVRKTEQGSESVNVLGGGFNTKTSRTTYRTRHELRLRGALFDTGVPLPLDASRADVEAAAHRIAAAGGWRAMRQEFVPKPGTQTLEVVELPLEALASTSP